MRRLRVGILDLLTTPGESLSGRAYDVVMTKQYASVTPQAIAVWCRELGHRAFYATYYGWGDPRRLLPDDLDVLFVASYTQASALAYALAKLYRRAGVRTVIGGPHAKAFPADCRRFFDLVVGDCDRSLIADILGDRYEPGSVVASAAPFAELPSVAARLPEITASALFAGRWTLPSTTIPLLASTGCPYACDFCVDWNRPYRPAPPAALRADLRFIAERLPRAMVAYHDPNFAVRFDEVLDAIETLPPAQRAPYIVETSLSVLRGDRTRRLRATNCVFVAPGVESWSHYSAKAGVGAATGRAKVRRLVEHFTELHEQVPYLQANFLFGLDGDDADETVALTKDFMEATPFVWPVVNIPHPFGGTPLFERQRREERILRALPFSFYYSPYLAAVPSSGSPAAFYRGLIELFSTLTAPRMLIRRLRTSRSRFARLFHVVRTRVKRERLHTFRRLYQRLEEDREFRDFHDGRSDVLPAVYERAYARALGPFAPLLSPADRRPVLS